MGTDCQRYAIIYTASSYNTEIYTGQLTGQRLYMGVFNLEDSYYDNPFGSLGIKYKEVLSIVL